MATVRRPWFVFAILLTCGIVGFAVTARWSAQSWLDLVDLTVSVVATFGVFLYASGREPFGAAFWRLFRWVFVGVASGQACDHAIEVASQHGYSMAGTVAFVLAMAVVIGWIFAFQWIAMTRLSSAPANIGMKPSRE
jgi:hypothetical protein